VYFNANFNCVFKLIIKKMISKFQTFYFVNATRNIYLYILYERVQFRAEKRTSFSDLKLLRAMSREI